MPTIKELRDQAARATNAARSILEAIPANASAEARAEENVKVDAHLEEARRYEADAARLEQLETIEAQQRSRAEQNEQRSREGNRPIVPGQSGGADGGSGGVLTYRSAFTRLAQNGFSLEGLAPEVRQMLASGPEAQANAETRTQVAGTNSAGGYTVPREMANMIEMAMAAYGPMFNEQICTVVTTQTGVSIDLPTIDDTSREAGASTEGADFTDGGGVDVTVGQKTLEAYMRDSEFVKFSPVLAQDSPFSWEQILADLLSEGLGRKANKDLTTGTGSSQPNGIVTASAAGKTCASSTAFTADEILDLVHSVDPAYRVQPKTRAMFNDTTLLALKKLKDGQGNYLIRESPDFAGRLIIGATVIPYSINQAMASIGVSAKFMVYGDFAKYYVRKVGQPVLGVLRERFWPQTGVAAYHRWDGELAFSAAVKHMKGAAS